MHAIICGELGRFVIHVPCPVICFALDRPPDCKDSDVLAEEAACQILLIGAMSIAWYPKRGHVLVGAMTWSEFLSRLTF